MRDVVSFYGACENIGEYNNTFIARHIMLCALWHHHRQARRMRAYGYSGIICHGYAMPAALCVIIRSSLISSSHAKRAHTEYHHHIRIIGMAQRVNYDILRHRIERISSILLSSSSSSSLDDISINFAACRAARRRARCALCCASSAAHLSFATH